MIAITLLGTGSPIPDPNRAGPATLIQAGEENYLVDAGRGVLMRLAAAGCGSNMLNGVMITHLHSCLLYTSPSPRDLSTSRMPSSA